MSAINASSGSSSSLSSFFSSPGLPGAGWYAMLSSSSSSSSKYLINRTSHIKNVRQKICHAIRVTYMYVNLWGFKFMGKGDQCYEINEHWSATNKDDSTVSSFWEKSYHYKYTLLRSPYLLPLHDKLSHDCTYTALRSPYSSSFPSSLAKGIAHRPLSLHPWQIERDFFLCLGRCKMAVPIYIFDCIHVMFTWSIVSGDLVGRR